MSALTAAPDFGTAPRGALPDRTTQNGPGRPAEPPGSAQTLAVANAALRHGFVLLPRTVLHAPGLSRDAKLLYAVLLSYAWQEGSCFPGYERLKSDLGCGINQVTKYMRELETAQLISRRRRGLGRTNVYIIHDPPAATGSSARVQNHQNGETGAKPQNHQIGETGLTTPVNALPPLRRRKQDSAQERDSGEQQQSTLTARVAHAPPRVQTEPAGVVALLVNHGVTAHVARELASTHDEATIHEQIEWHRYRPTVTKNPAGALVRAIRDGWAAPQSWAEAKQREAAHAQQQEQLAAERAEEEERRRRLAAMTPEERVQGPLEFWITGQKIKGRQPTEAEITARRAELLARFAGGAAAAGSDAG